MIYVVEFLVKLLSFPGITLFQDLYDTIDQHTVNNEHFENLLKKTCFWKSRSSL